MFCSRIQHKSESFQFHLVLETDSLKEHYFFKQMKAEVLLTQLEKNVNHRSLNVYTSGDRTQQNNNSPGQKKKLKCSLT